MDSRTLPGSLAERGAMLRRGRPAPANDPVTREVLVATDFSDVAEAAVDAAATLASSLGARLLILHAVSVAPLAHADFVWIPTAAEIEAATKKGFASLDAAAARVRGRHPLLGVDTRIVDGILPDALLEAIADRKPEIVVVGSHGHGFWSSLVLGSTSRAIATLAMAPVLTVRREGAELGGGPILAPVELGWLGERSLDFAVGLASALGRKLRLLYVFPGDVASEVDDGGADEIGVRARAELELLVKPERARDLDVEVVTRFGRPARRIVEEAKACGASFVVLGRHRRSIPRRIFDGSVADDVARLHHGPVLSCREEGD
jgi:nucleotide-binding universal stress UspA family protein